jgi:O-antigen ligase
MFLNNFGYFTNKDFRISYDMLLVVGLGIIMILGYLFNISTATFSNLQAYLLGLLCYVFVKKNCGYVSLNWFFYLLRVFLLTNSLLVVIQFLSGYYFPAKYFAAGSPPLVIPSGFSDGPTKNGMLLTFALCTFIGLFSFGKSKLGFFDLLILFVSIPALLLSASRSSVGAFVIIIIVAVLLILFSKKQKISINSKGLISIVFFFTVFLIIADKYGVLDVIENFGNTESSSKNIILYKLTRWEDDSIEERFENNYNTWSLVQNHPFAFLTFGIGVGSFEFINSTNIHNSYLEILLQTGLLGFLFFCSLIILIFSRVFQNGKRDFVFPLFLGLLAIMIFMGFHDILRGRIFWLPLALLAFYTKRNINIS